MALSTKFMTLQTMGTKKEDDTQAMQKNVESQAKLNGLIVDRTENKNHNIDETHDEYIKRCAELKKDE